MLWKVYEIKTDPEFELVPVSKAAPKDVLENFTPIRKGEFILAPFYEGDDNEL